MKQNVIRPQRKLFNVFQFSQQIEKNQFSAYYLCVIQLFFSMQNKRITEK